MAHLSASIGNLSQRVTIQKVSRAPNASGQMIETWSDVGSFYAEVIGTGGDEYIRGQQVEANIVSLIRIRYPRGRDKVLPLMRVIVDGDRPLNIARVLDRTGRKVELWLHCKEMDGANKPT